MSWALLAEILMVVFPIYQFKEEQLLRKEGEYCSSRNKTVRVLPSSHGNFSPAHRQHNGPRSSWSRTSEGA